MCVPAPRQPEMQFFRPFPSGVPDWFPFPPLAGRILSGVVSSPNWLGLLPFYSDPPKSQNAKFKWLGLPFSPPPNWLAPPLDCPAPT